MFNGEYSYAKINTSTNFNEKNTKNESTHYVIALHGIGHGKADFGNLMPALQSHYEQHFGSSSNKKLKVIYFEYDTSSNQVGLQDLQNRFLEFLKTNIALWKNSNWNLSLIGYSLGGLILQEALMSEAFNQLAEQELLFDKIKNIFLIANPYWGSLMANWGTDLKPIIGFIPFYSVFGKKLLQEMSLNSWLISDRFHQFHNLNNEKLNRLNNIFSKIPVIQISGVTDPNKFPFDFIKSFNNYIESDLAVPLANSQWNHYFYTEKESNINWEEVKPSQFQFLNMPYKHIILDGTHLPDVNNFLSPEMQNLLNVHYVSMMDVHKICITDLNKCPQKVLQIILNSIVSAENENPNHKDNIYPLESSTSLMEQNLNRITLQLEILFNPNIMDRKNLKYQILFSNPSFTNIDSSRSLKGLSYYFVGQNLNIYNKTNGSSNQIKTNFQNRVFNTQTETLTVQLVNSKGDIQYKKIIQFPAVPGVLSYVQIHF